MKEPFDDEQLYDEREQGAGLFGINNYKSVLQKYKYCRYLHRFRTLADRHRLSPGQRPKLNENQFASLMQKLTDAMVSRGEINLLNDERNVKIASRLLIAGLFDTDVWE